MQCPVCHRETTHYVEVSQVATTLYVALFDICSNWQHSPGICCACIDSLDLKTDTSFQSILNGATIPERSLIPYNFSLTDREHPYWFHSDESIRLWYRAELFQKVESIAYNNNHLNWTIVDRNSELLDYGEMPYES